MNYGKSGFKREELLLQGVYTQFILLLGIIRRQRRKAVYIHFCCITLRKTTSFLLTSLLDLLLLLYPFQNLGIMILSSQRSWKDELIVLEVFPVMWNQSVIQIKLLCYQIIGLELEFQSWLDQCYVDKAPSEHPFLLVCVFHTNKLSDVISNDVWNNLSIWKIVNHCHPHWTFSETVMKHEWNRIL